MQAVASSLATSRSANGSGQAPQYLVRLNKTVLALLEAAKPANQSMVEFLRECALLVSLQRLEASQK